MSSLAGRVRFASLLAAVCALLIAGAAAGAAGSALILGQNNDSGTSHTTLANAGFGAAFTLQTTNGSGGATGIFGWTTSTTTNATRGVYGRADGLNSYGVYAVNTSSGEGNGAALFANGGQNEGVFATSADTDALHGLVTFCDGSLMCGGNGVAGTGYGNAAGVYGDGLNTLGGVWGSGGSVAGVIAQQTQTYLPALYADSPSGTGVYAIGENGDGVDQNCSDGPCLPQAGGVFNGTNGVIGETDTQSGVGVYANTTVGLSFALYANGPTHIEGDLTVSGTCTGCALAANAINGSASTLKQGDAVALEGITQAKDGSLLLIVRAAGKGDTISGIVDRALKAAPDSNEVGGVTRMIKVNRGGDKKVTSRTTTLKAPKGGLWEDGGTSVGAHTYLRIVTSGLFAFAGAPPADAAVGDAVAVTGTNGKLGKAAPDAGAKAGKYLGLLKDGSVVLMVDPS